MKYIRNVLIILFACLGITFAQDFGYSGGVQTFTASTGGVYKLEVWGAKGGDTGDGDGSAGAAGGGYAKGYVTLTQGQKLYVVVGSQGCYASSGNNGPTCGGYNGGGNGWQKFSASGHRQAAGGGGGATHIATTNRGVLSNYYYYQSEVLIVAGGSAGARLARYDTDSFSVLGAGGSGGTGGGYGFGYGQDGSTGDDWANSGGGGGWSGGSVNNGGTNYVGGVTTWNGDSVSSLSNQRWDNGYARITLVQEIKYNLDLNSILNGSQIYSLGDAATANVYINGNLVCSNCADWCQDYGSGTTYKIDITPKSNYSVVSGGTCQGTIGSSSVGCNPVIKQKFTVTINVNNGYSTIRDTKLWSDIYRLPKAPDITGYTFQHYKRIA